MAAAIAAAQQLNDGGMGNSDDEGDEVEDFGPGAVDPGRLHVEGAPAVGQLSFEVHCAERAARRASSNNAASYAMTEKSWSANDRATARFLRFLAVAYGQVDGPGAEPLEEQALRLATTLDAALPHRLRRFFAMLRAGGRAHLTGGKGSPLSMASIANMASSLGHFYAQASQDFAGQTPYVSGCRNRKDSYKPIPAAARSAAQVASGETHEGNPVNDQVVANWLAGSSKRATLLGERAAQTPPITPDTMSSAGLLATDGVGDGAPVEDVTTLQLERIILFTIMVFSWCTMLRPDDLLGLACRDVSFAPQEDAINSAFYEEHGHPRWVRVRYSQLKTNVAGTAPTPAYYFWSSRASDAEMRASAEFDGAGVCVRCPWLWCDLPFFCSLYVHLRQESPGFSMNSAAPFFVTHVGGDAGAWGAMGNVPVTKVWWQTHLDAFVLSFDPALSARGVGGLYGFRRGATQFWLAHTGDVEMVMRMGVWKANSSRFLFYVLNFECRGTIRARIKNHLRVDRSDFRVRLEEMVERFMEWFEQRVLEMMENDHGNVFAAGLGLEVADKILHLVENLLKTHAGVANGVPA